MLRQDVDIRKTSVYIAGEHPDAGRIGKFFRNRGFEDVHLVVHTGKREMLDEIQAASQKERHICLAIFFLDDIRELRYIQQLAALENCGVVPVVTGEGVDITLILLQKTDIKDVEQVPLDLETFFLRAEKMLIRLHMQHRIVESNQKNRDFFLKILKVMAKLLEERDEYTEHHSENVATIACAIAERFGFNPEEINKLEMAGLLHDFGKIGITDKILNKPGKLTDEEYMVIKRHPSIAQVILEPVSGLEDIIPWIKHHHERWDGFGYPDKLKGTDIPLAARILAVADSFDTMHSRRTYQEPKDEEYILNEFHTKKGEQWDPEVVDVFLEILSEKELELIT